MACADFKSPQKYYRGIKDGNFVLFGGKMSEIANFQSARIVDNPHGQSEIHRHCRKSAHAKYNPQISSKNPHGFTGICKPHEKSARPCRNPQSLAEIRTRQRMMRGMMRNEDEQGARYGRARHSDDSDARRGQAGQLDSPDNLNDSDDSNRPDGLDKQDDSGARRGQTRHGQAEQFRHEKIRTERMQTRTSKIRTGRTFRRLGQGMGGDGHITSAKMVSARRDRVR